MARPVRTIQRKIPGGAVAGSTLRPAWV